MHMTVITPKNGLHLIKGTALKFISKEYLSNLELPISDLSKSELKNSQ